MDFKKHCQLDFGKYVEVHNKPSPTDDMESRTRPCVALGPTDNLQGTYKFMDINTGMKLKKRSWTCILVPDAVIGKLMCQAEHEKRDVGWCVRNQNKEEFDFNDGLEEATSITHLEPDAHPDLPAELPGV